MKFRTGLTDAFVSTKETSLKWARADRWGGIPQTAVRFPSQLEEGQLSPCHLRHVMLTSRPGHPTGLQPEQSTCGTLWLIDFPHHFQCSATFSDRLHRRLVEHAGFVVRFTPFSLGLFPFSSPHSLSWEGRAVVCLHPFWQCTLLYCCLAAWDCELAASA